MIGITTTYPLQDKKLKISYELPVKQEWLY